MDKKQAATLAATDPRIHGVRVVGGGVFEFLLYKTTTRGSYRPTDWYVAPALDDDGTPIPGSFVALESFLARTVVEFNSGVAGLIAEGERVRRGLEYILSFMAVEEYV
jgi:hypothetical protein